MKDHKSWLCFVKTVTCWSFRGKRTLTNEIYLRSADNVGRPFCCCVVFSFLFIFLFFLLFLSHYLRSAISLPFFTGSLSYLASWSIITCRIAVYILEYEGQRSRSQGDTRWKCLFSNFSAIYHPIVFKFSCLIVLGKETTWCKFQGRT